MPGYRPLSSFRRNSMVQLREHPTKASAIPSPITPPPGTFSTPVTTQHLQPPAHTDALSHSPASPDIYSPPSVARSTVNTDELSQIAYPVYDVPNTRALISALQDNTGTKKSNQRAIIIPGNRKRKRTLEKATPQTRHLRKRVRHGAVLVATVCVMIVTFLSLSPLGSAQNGQREFFQSVLQWVQTQQYNWLIASNISQPGQATSNPALPVPPPMTLSKSEYVAIARQAAASQGIPPEYFVRQIQSESGFNPNAISPAGAIGIAQFMPATAAGLGVNPYNPVDALNGAARLMAMHYKQYGGDYAKALAAYNAGGATVNYAIKVGGANWMNHIPAETRHYITKVMGI